MEWIIRGELKTAKGTTCYSYVTGEGLFGDVSLYMGDYGFKHVKKFTKKTEAQKYLREHIYDNRFKVVKYET